MTRALGTAKHRRNARRNEARHLANLLTTPPCEVCGTGTRRQVGGRPVCYGCAGGQ